MTDRKRVTIYLTDGEYNELKTIAEKEGCSMSRVVGSLIHFWNSDRGYFAGCQYNLKYRYWIRLQ